MARAGESASDRVAATRPRNLGASAPTLPLSLADFAATVIEFTMMKRGASKERSTEFALHFEDASSNTSSYLSGGKPGVQAPLSSPVASLKRYELATNGHLLMLIVPSMRSIIIQSVPPVPG